MSTGEKSVSRQEKIIKTLEAQLRLQDERIIAMGEKVAVLEAGARELSELLDAVMINTVLAYGTDVPLGKTLELPEVKVGEILERWELHGTQTKEMLTLTAVEKSRVQEMEEEMG